MQFKGLATYLERLEKTSSRNEMTRILAELLGKADTEEIEKIVYLSLGQLTPTYEATIFSIADTMMLKVLASAYGEKVENVKKLYKKLGDVGDVAFDLAGGRRVTAKKLEVGVVYEKLLEVAKDAGEGSQERKIEKMAVVLRDLDPLSAKYAARIPVGRLRLGFSDKTVIDALSWMSTGDKSASGIITKAYQVLPDVGRLAKRVKQYGVKKACVDIVPVVGVPVLPMLAQRLKSPADMIEKMEKVGVEPKLDGLRLSIHFKRKTGGLPAGRQGFVKAFTRNLKDNSWMFPELKNIGKHIRADSVILDCEAVGLDEETKQMANFQQTMTRRRKHEIEATLAKIGIDFYIFDILSKNGKAIMDLPYIERKKILAETVKAGGMFKKVDYEVTNDPARINTLYLQNRRLGFEGVLVKKLDAPYVPGRTGWRWVKMKQEETSEAKLADTVDVVVMGYTVGRGKRAGFGVGQFLVGVRDGETFKTTSKIGTGLTDEQFREMKARLAKLEIAEKPKEYEVGKVYTPDYWVIPSLVVEVAADEITKSPSHSAGLALRFPRLIKFRDDKSPKQAASIRDLMELYGLQK